MSFLTPRRSFIKFLGGMVGSLALPNVVKTAIGSFAPEAETVADMEEIFQGLVQRFKTIRLSKEDGVLIASFLQRFKTKSAEESKVLQSEYNELYTQHGHDSPEAENFRRSKMDQVIHFGPKSSTTNVMATGTSETRTSEPLTIRSFRRSSELLSPS